MNPSTYRATPSPTHWFSGAAPRFLRALLIACFLLLTAAPIPATDNAVEGQVVGQSFLLIYQRPHPVPSGFEYIVEGSDDLVIWSTDGLVTESAVVDGAIETLTIRDGVLVGPSPAKRFMRLRVVESGVTAPQSVTVPSLSGTAEVGQTLTATNGTWNDPSGETVAYTYQWFRNGVPIDGATAATYLTVAADAGATLTVQVTATNSGGSTNALSAGIGPIIAPVAALAIRPDGWTAEVTFDGLTTGGTYALAPDTSSPALKMTVVSPGFDANGSPTTFQREIVATVPLRQPYPNHALHTETAVSGGVTVTLALSDRVYAGDTVTTCTLLQGVYTSNSTPSPAGFASRTNGSTLAYPKAVGGWADIQYERATGTSHDVEFLAFHRHPREGRQVACVEFIATDVSGNSTTVKSSEMVASTRVTGGNPVAVYRASIPLADLVQGQQVKVRTKTYPFIGDSSSILDSDPSVDGAAMPTPNLTNLIFLNDRTGGYGTVYAYVSPTGNNSTAVVSTNAATAEAAPFATIQAAAAKIQTMNNASFGHNDIGGGVIRLVTGTYAGFGASMGTLTAGKTWLTIEAAPGHNPQGVILTTGTQKRVANLVKFRNMFLQPAATAVELDHILVDGVVDANNVTTPSIYGSWENVEFVGDATRNSPMIYRIGMRYFLNCRFKDVRTAPASLYSTTCVNTPLLAGCTMDASANGAAAWAPHMAIGNILLNGNQLSEVAKTASVIPPDGFIIAFNSAYSLAGTTGYGVNHSSIKGFAIVQNLFERVTNPDSPLFCVAHDGTLAPVANVIVQHITTSGARTNFLYNDIGTVAIPKTGVLLYSVLDQYNIKTDTFVNGNGGANGGRTGNWEPVHGVGISGNLYIRLSAKSPNSPPYYDPTSWSGSYHGQHITIKADPSFISDQSMSTTNSGNGDYHIGATSSARNKVPAGMAALPFDLSGAPRLNDGTGAAGAFEYVP